MKTRSNDIIPNAPFSYNSSTNTFEIDSNLEVYGYLDAYNDSSLTFYQGNNAQTPSMGVSPFFGENKLSFFYNDGQDIDTSIKLDTSVDADILTDKNTKTLFGNSLYGSGNIDLYVHYLSIIADNKFYYGVVYSSNNIIASSPQKLTTLFKATPDTPLDCITLSNIDTNTVGLLKWTGDIWMIQLANDNFVNVTNVTDVVETL